jgi:hypothetical protein
MWLFCKCARLRKVTVDIDSFRKAPPVVELTHFTSMWNQSVRQRANDREDVAQCHTGAAAKTEHRRCSCRQHQLGKFRVYGGTVPAPRIYTMAAEGISFNN